VLRILFVCDRILKSSETKDSIYDHVGPYVGRTYVNRLDKTPERSHVIRNTSVRLFLLSERRTKFPFVQKEASPRREFERDDCTCATERSDPVLSVTFLTIKEFPLDDSRASLLIIRLDRK